MMQASPASSSSAAQQQQQQLRQSPPPQPRQLPSYVQRIQPEQFIASHLHGTRPSMYNTIPVPLATAATLPPQLVSTNAHNTINTTMNSITSTGSTSGGNVTMSDRFTSYHTHFHSGLPSAAAVNAPPSSPAILRSGFANAQTRHVTPTPQPSHVGHKSTAASPWASPPQPAANMMANATHAATVPSRDHTAASSTSPQASLTMMKGHTSESAELPQPSFVHRIDFRNSCSGAPPSISSSTTTTRSTNGALHGPSDFVYGDAPRIQPALDLVPPFRFALVAEEVYRGAYPTLRNFPFLRELGLKTIVSLTPESPTYDLRCFAEANGITLLHLQAERYKGEARLLPTDLNAALGWIIDAERQPLYIHCLDGRHVVGLVLMALRKLQHWSPAAAHAEYRRFARELSDEVQFIADYAGPVTVPRRVCRWISEDVALPAALSSNAQGGLAATTNYRGESTMRRTHSGIRLRYLTTQTTSTSGNMSGTEGRVTGAAVSKEESDSNTAVAATEGCTRAPATEGSMGAIANTNSTVAPAKDEQAQATLSTSDLTSQQPPPHVSTVPSIISSGASNNTIAAAAGSGVDVNAAAAATIEVQLPGTVVVPGEGTYVDLDALQPSFTTQAHVATRPSGQSVMDSVVRVLPTPQSPASNIKHAIVVTSEPTLSSSISTSAKEYNAEASRYTNNNSVTSSSGSAITLAAPDRSHTRRPLTERSGTSEAMSRTTTIISANSIKTHQGTSPLQSTLANNNNNNSMSSSNGNGNVVWGNSPLSVDTSPHEGEMPARLTASLSALGMSFPSALQYMEGHTATSRTRNTDGMAEAGRAGQEGGAEDGVSGSTSSRRLRRRMSL